MSDCEKCWSDAHLRDPHNVTAKYNELIDERRSNPCTPEQQAGPNAKECPACGRLTLHQNTNECMNCDRFTEYKTVKRWMPCVPTAKRKKNEKE